MSIINFDRSNELVDEFLNEVSTTMPLDYKVLSFWGDDSTGMSDFYENYRGRHFRNLCSFVALGGLFPQVITDALTEGNLYSFHGYEWCNEEGLGLTDINTVKGIDMSKAIVICDRANLKNKEALEILSILTDKGVKVWTLSDIYAAKIAESVITEDDFLCYLKNIGAKLVNGVWEIKFKKYTVLTLEFNDEKDCWMYHEGTQKLEFRQFYSINGIPTYNCPHKIALLVLNYLLTAYDEGDLKGRRAYLGGVFTDITSVGVEHKLLAKFKQRKVGLLMVGCKTNNWLPLLCESGDLIGAAQAYEKLGYSVFMHKGAKYIVVDAGITGFRRTPEGKTQVAWAADKAAKLTGRALWNVPTAEEYIDDDED